MCILCLLSFGCDRTKPLNENDYRQTVEDAARQIPEALDLERIFPDTDHFITHYNLPGTQWYNAEVYIDGGYDLAIQAEIKIDYSKNEVIWVGERKVYFGEYSKIYIRPNGQMEGRMVERPNPKIDDALWQQFIESGGDIKLLGVPRVRDRLDNWDKYVQMSKKNLLVVSELSDGQEKEGGKSNCEAGATGGR